LLVAKVGWLVTLFAFSVASCDSSSTILFFADSSSELLCEHPKRSIAVAATTNELDIFFINLKIYFRKIIGSGLLCFKAKSFCILVRIICPALISSFEMRPTNLIQ
jgi:hypothetical protein